MWVKLLGNPHSGRQDDTCALSTFRQIVTAWGWRADAEHVDLDQAATAAQRATQAGYDMVMVAGGDGTLREVARSMIDTGIPVLPLPCGTGNDLARSLGLPLDPYEALAIAYTGRPERIDVGLVNGRLFLNVVALGISAQVSQAIETDHKRRWGSLAYLAKAIEIGLRPAPMPLYLQIDHRTEDLWAYQVSIANGCSFGGGWRISDCCGLQDGLLDVVVIEPMTVWQVLQNLASPKGGLAGNLATRAYRTPACRIVTASPIAVNLDGDAAILSSPLDFQILAGALTVMVPATTAPTKRSQAGWGRRDQPC